MRSKALPKQLDGGTKKVRWTFFARALNPKKRGRNQTLRVTDFCLSAQWLIGTTPTYGTCTSYSTVRGQDYEIETAFTDFCLSAQWLIGTTPTYGTRTS